MSEVKNRRENLYINEVPPEVLTEEAALDAVADAGFVKNTDYAAGDTGGVVKVSASTGTAVSSAGILLGSVRTAVQYSSGAGTTMICKGTLENVIQALVKRELIALLGGVDADVTGTMLSSWFAERTADGWNIAAAKSTPTP